MLNKIKVKVILLIFRAAGKLTMSTVPRYVVHIVDLDDVLISWAMEKLGPEYTVEKIDASHVCIVTIVDIWLLCNRAENDFPRKNLKSAYAPF